jgi:hypothetical protein
MPPSGARDLASSLKQAMEKASAALRRNQWFEAERLAQKALEGARSARDFGLMARITLPLQEARRQRLQAALDKTGVKIVDEPFGEAPKLKPGCHLIQPPLVGADARRLRLFALEQEIPVAVICREPRTKTGLCPIVCIGEVTIRTRIAPPKNWDKPTVAWFAGAMEALGDAAIETLDRAALPVRQVDELIRRLDACPDHEKLHQALAEACVAAEKWVLEGGVLPPEEDPDADPLARIEDIEDPDESEADASPDRDE